MIAALDWEPLQRMVSTCVACDLATSRTQAVFGSGPTHPAWLVIGEAPGADEDERGEPFVGTAGRLLDAMLASLGLSRERDVFVTNVVKCRPPGDREAAAHEIACCRPYLDRQIALLAPRVVLTMGPVASAALLGADAATAERVREHSISVDGRLIPVAVTHHPAHLMRSGDEKAQAWADLCFARSLYERAIAAAPD